MTVAQVEALGPEWAASDCAADQYGMSERDDGVDIEALTAALEGLPAEDRALVTEAYGLDGHDRKSAVQIARELGVAPSTVARRLARAESCLRDRLTMHASSVV
jgi:DNA-directed RNA polymerase specialized sigma24 family protein